MTTMVDFRKGGVMADRIDNLTERVQAVEGKVDHLTGRVYVVEDRVHVVEEKVDHLSRKLAELSASVDQRFDAVDAAFVEQRQYTEFAYARLDAKMDAGFGRVDVRFDRLERKLDQVIDLRRPRRTRKPRR